MIGLSGRLEDLCRDLRRSVEPGGPAFGPCRWQRRKFAALRMLKGWTSIRQKAFGIYIYIAFGMWLSSRYMVQLVTDSEDLDIP